MALLNAKLYIRPSGAAATACNLYSTIAEVGGDYVAITASGIKAYAKLGGTSDPFNTKSRVLKDGTTYAILTWVKAPYTKVEYRTPGTYTITIPADALTAKVTVAGGGGGGGGGYLKHHNMHVGCENYTGGTGGRGALLTQTSAVTAGTYSVIVGAGGAGGGAGGNSGNTGGTSSVFSISAQGGTGGGNNLAHGTSYGNGGVGGAGGRGCDAGSAGSPGWVIIEYGGDI